MANWFFRHVVVAISSRQRMQQSLLRPYRSHHSRVSRRCAPTTAFMFAFFPSAVIIFHNSRSIAHASGGRSWRVVMRMRKKGQQKNRTNEETSCFSHVIRLWVLSANAHINNVHRKNDTERLVLSDEWLTDWFQFADARCEARRSLKTKTTDRIVRILSYLRPRTTCHSPSTSHSWRWITFSAHVFASCCHSLRWS